MSDITLWKYGWMIIAIIIFGGLITYFIYLWIKYRREKNKINSYLFENHERISNIQRKINLCQNQAELYAVKQWAIASAENMYNEMTGIAYDIGYDEGKKLINDIKRRLSIKEEILSEPQP